MLQSSSYIELSRSNLLHNIRQLQSLTGQTEIFAVVKGNAYGHGQKEIVSILNETAIDGYMVFDIYEALQLAEQTNKKIGVLGFTREDKELIQQASLKKIILPVLNLAQATKLNEFNMPLSVQIKVDMGTNRLGIRIEEAHEQIKEISKLSNLKITGVFSHFADSENADRTFTERQFALLKGLINQLKSSGLNFNANHCACTAALLQNHNFHLDAVRLGIGLYGLWPSEATKEFDGITLRPVMQWKSKVLQLKRINKGESVGYGQSWIAPVDTTIATIPVGYYDGYSRSLSNNSSVIINKTAYPLRGRVCMNLIMVEVDATIQVGDVVTLLGEGITAEDLADKAGTINYEIVTRISSHIHRIII